MNNITAVVLGSFIIGLVVGLFTSSVTPSDIALLNSRITKVEQKIDMIYDYSQFNDYRITYPEEYR